MFDAGGLIDPHLTVQEERRSIFEKSADDCAEYWSQTYSVTNLFVHLHHLCSPFDFMLRISMLEWIYLKTC